MDTASLIHLDYLRKLSRGDDKFIGDILALFLKNTPKAIKSMKEYYENKNWEDLMMEAHKIRPSFNFLGLKELEDAAKTIENYSSDRSNLSQVGELISKIEKSVDIVYQELEAELKHLSH